MKNDQYHQLAGYLMQIAVFPYAFYHFAAPQMTKQNAKPNRYRKFEVINTLGKFI